MKTFERLSAIAAPLPMAHVDTDKILPARFMKTISRSGLADGLFAALRQDPDFVLNRAPWSGAGILVALDNFGCGSSREHAPWALLDFGIRCIIAPSFADIFRNNCIKNGILPALVSQADVERLLEAAGHPASAQLDIDLPAQSIRSADGSVCHFDIEPAHKQALLEGIDDIARTLQCDGDIAAFEAKHRERYPWLQSSSALRLDFQ
ncbi:MAG TPA: 3-isopropylmalate dehydratase small subunit [Luteibacter sp.]|jgi:3-isopropylmalate/(R)-2-methylmalate dehydratase small subunit|nr:3-isopropylmalate dehydratase small subunit [Luteibacter sp.]